MDDINTLVRPELLRISNDVGKHMEKQKNRTNEIAEAQAGMEARMRAVEMDLDRRESRASVGGGAGELHALLRDSEGKGAWSTTDGWVKEGGGL